MSTIFQLYFGSLIKRFLLLCLVCSFIPLVIISNQYDLKTSLLVYKDSLFFTFPWLILFQQIVFCAFLTPKDLLSRVYLLIVSTLLSTIILMVALPSTQTNFHIEFDKIIPKIVQPKHSIILNNSGTFIIDPLKTSTPLYATKNTKALLISSNLFSFKTLKTNTQSYALTEPFSFTSYGFQAQNGSMIYPFFQEKSTSFELSLAQKIMQYWLDSVLIFNQTMNQLYQTINVNFKTSQSIYYTNIRTKKPSRQKNVYNTKIFQEYQKLVNNSKTKSSPMPKSIPITVVNYINIFTSILCIFALFALIGILISIRQHFAGIFALIMLLAFFIPYISTNFFQLVLKLSNILPSFSILLLNIALTFVFYIISIILYNFKPSTRS